MNLSDFDYELPPERIAQEPLQRRDQSRMLVYDRSADEVHHATIADLPRWLREDDLLVVNDTRVLPARLHARRKTGAQVEFLLLERLPVPTWSWSALVHPARKLREGERVWIEDSEVSVRMGVRPRDAAGRAMRSWPIEFLGPDGRPIERDEVGEALLEKHGRMPLPPYIERAKEAEAAVAKLDRERYQTVFARVPGAVAAPTAGLHLTDALLEELEARGVRRAAVTLHVGAGTFQPVRDEDVREHRMHSEVYELPAGTADAIAGCRASRGRVVAVGTTSARVLETCAQDGAPTAARGRTSIFILPGHEFRCVDVLLTNFHLPRSTLLMMVSALVGRERTLELYREAVERGYRFYSYGDAMLIL